MRHKFQSPIIKHQIQKYLFGFGAWLLMIGYLTSCSPTYKRETIKQSLIDLAKKEFKLDVTAQETGDTVGIRYEVKNFMGELTASDQLVWTQIENLLMVMGRVALSSTRPPRFLVLDVVDAENPGTHLYFTRYTWDLQKVMGEAMSRSDYLDRLLIEFEANGKRSVFDPQEMDIVRLMMMTGEVNAENESENRKELSAANAKSVDDVNFPVFLANIATNSLRRQLKEKEEKENNFSFRQVSGFYLPHAESRGSQDQSATFRFQLDVVPLKGGKGSSAPFSIPMPIEKGALDPLLTYVASEVQKILKSYKFDQFSLITVVEKNSGKFLSVPRT